jgi:hypothetical protein
LPFSLSGRFPAEERAAVRGCGAQRSNRRRRPKALDGGPSGGYPAKEKPGVLVGFTGVVWGRIPPVLTR